MLNNLNSIIIEGNTTTEPVLDTLDSGHMVCRFTIATNRFYKQDEQTKKEVSYIEIEAWSRLAQTCKDTLTQGRGLRVVGRIKQDRWQDASGKMQAKIKIVAEHVEFKPLAQRTPMTVEETV